jgi:DNA-binding transcriptional regulator GbsR (MarR family)
MKNTSAVDRFIRHWGEMGGRWGVSRSVAQIHALLYLATDPLPADEITHRLGIARSAVSLGLRELMGYGIVRLVHRHDDRRDHFEAVADPWELFVQIVEERRKREIEPTLSALRDCLAEADREGAPSRPAARRIRDLLSLIEELDRWYSDMKRVPASTLRALLKLGPAVTRIAGAMSGRRKS